MKPGQLGVEHSSVSLYDPWQSTGLPVVLHILYLTCIPVPHVTEQSDQLFHVTQSAVTYTQKKTKLFYTISYNSLFLTISFFFLFREYGPNNRAE